jgi:FlaA1/EpsC-like NDP-sugar epimerase
MREQPRSLILLERAEHALYEIHRELVGRDPDGQVELVPTVIDVTDSDGCA